MRILFLSSSNPFPAEGIGGYCGGGWISSLIKLVDNVDGIDVGVAYATDVHEHERNVDGIELLPVFVKPLSGWQKIKLYYGGYRHINNDYYTNGALMAIESFKPDVIHLFGMESQFAWVLGHTDVPIVCHLQGLLAPYDNAFFPIGMNESSFHWPPTKREWLLRNGYLYAKKCIHVRGQREIKLFKELQYAMGRTEWDFEVSQLLAPQSKYFHVDEVLRQPFYDNAGKWNVKAKGKLIILSTLSETIYKGLDLVLKTAKLLKEETKLDFEWNVIGIGTNSNFVRFFEHTYGIKSHEVNINYLGVKQPDDIIRILLDASVYVHTSYIDNSPNSICEAQILGLPVIGTYVGGIPSLIENRVTGILVPANGSYELAYQLQYIQGHPDFCRELSQNGFAVAMKRHNKEKILKDLITVYNKLIG